MYPRRLEHREPVPSQLEGGAPKEGGIRPRGSGGRRFSSSFSSPRKAKKTRRKTPRKAKAAKRPTSAPRTAAQALQSRARRRLPFSLLARHSCVNLTARGGGWRRGCSFCFWFETRQVRESWGGGSRSRRGLHRRGGAGEGTEAEGGEGGFSHHQLPHPLL